MEGSGVQKREVAVINLMSLWPPGILHQKVLFILQSRLNYLHKNMEHF